VTDNRVNASVRSCPSEKNARGWTRSHQSSRPNSSGRQSGSLGCVRCGRISFGLENLASDYKTIAIEHYEKFLNLWKDADPGIAEVEDARKRLVGLQDN
jgi:hypothetical protein